MKAEELMDAIGALDESLVNPDVQMIQNHQPISENDAEQTVPLRARKHRGTVLTWVGAAAAVALIAFGGWFVLGRAAKQRNGPGALQASQPASATGEATSTNPNETGKQTETDASVQKEPTAEDETQPTDFIPDGTTDVGSLGGVFYTQIYPAGMDFSSSNPWNPKDPPTALPVYRNLACTHEEEFPTMNPVGAAKYLGEEKMRALADEVADALGWKVLHAKYESDELSEELYVTLDGGSIDVHGNGDIQISFPFKDEQGWFIPASGAAERPEDFGYETPEDLDDSLFTLPEGGALHSGDPAVIKQTVQELAERFSELTGFENPAVALESVYDIYGEQNWRNFVYDTVPDKTQTTVNYNFQRVSFYSDEEETHLLKIWISNPLVAAEAEPEQPIRSEQEARSILLGKTQAGSSQEKPWGSMIMDADDLVEASLREENIAAVELVYGTQTGCKVFEPYYKYTVKLDNTGLEDVYPSSLQPGWYEYGTFYVPAIP